MIKYGVLGAILVLVATAVIATFNSSDQTSVSPVAESNTSDFALEQRIARLEQLVAEERESRIQLEQKLTQLASMPSQLGGDSGENNDGPRSEFIAALTGDGELSMDIQDIREQIQERRNQNRDEDTETRQISNLVEAGFEEYQAQELVRRIEETQMALINARFEAEQSGEDFNQGQFQQEATAQLRSDLGDTDYERYLEATNQSTSIGVSNVLASSPAEIAGIQTGDEIISYNGERVFNTNELNRLTGSVESSGNVIVEVLRDGEPVSLSLPTGPLGITSSGRGRQR